MKNLISLLSLIILLGSISISPQVQAQSSEVVNCDSGEFRIKDAADRRSTQFYLSGEALNAFQESGVYVRPEYAKDKGVTLMINETHWVPTGDIFHTFNATYNPNKAGAADDKIEFAKDAKGFILMLNAQSASRGSGTITIHRFDSCIVDQRYERTVTDYTPKSAADSRDSKPSCTCHGGPGMYTYPCEPILKEVRGGPGMYPYSMWVCPQ